MSLLLRLVVLQHACGFAPDTNDLEMESPTEKTHAHLIVEYSSNLPAYPEAQALAELNAAVCASP